MILSQIKKSNFPFVEVRIEKQNLLAAAEIDKPDGERDKDDSSNQVDHYKSVVLFLDEAEVMVEAALFPQLLEIRKSIEQI